jgi:DNA polymerase-3 subunit delta
MYQQALEKLLKNKSVPRDMMLFGYNFFIDYYFEKLKKFYNADEVVTIYSFEYKFEVALSTLSSGSLFGDTTLLIIKSEDKIPTRELKELRRMVSKGDNSFLYLYYGDAKDVSKPFEDNFVRFFEPNEHESFHFVFEEAKKFDVYLNENQIYTILHLKHGDLSQIYGELHKLSTLDSENINKIGIENIISASGEIQGEQIVNDFFNHGNWVKTINAIEEYEINRIDFLSILIRTLHEIYLFRSSMELREALNSKSVLGRSLPPQIEQEKIRLGKKFSLKQISKMLFLAMREEAKFKSGRSGEQTLSIGELLIEMKKS